jgi:signal transduction histidine kinase
MLGAEGMRDHDQTLLRLIEIGRALVAELDPEAVLDQILREAREITGAKYAALGVVSEDRQGLERFLTSGIDEDTQRAIGSLPRGLGLLGTLISDPRPLRLENVSTHPHSFGFPANHPPMQTFLGAPIMIRGQAWGNLYLSEKADGESFTTADEDAVTFLAQWAATAIENARLHESSERRRVEAEHAVRSLQAAQDIADAIGSVAELDLVLELIVQRGRALVEAQSVLILLREGDDLVVAASAGQIVGELGRRIPISGTTTGQVLLRGQPERIADLTTHVGRAASEMGAPDARSALIVPMFHRSVGIGVLAAFDRGLQGESFQYADEQLLRTFAASAANAVAVKRSVDSDRLHAQIAGAEAERRRWARELHDQTLQSLGALRVLLSAAARRGDPESHERAIRQAIADLEVETENLRGIITDLRPSLLDDLGLLPALDSLLDRRREAGLKIESEIELPAPGDGGPELEPELATTIYRLVQESLTNVVKHSRARSCRVIVTLSDRHELVVEVTDDGHGYDTSLRTPGFGLPGMRERVYLAGGRLELESGNGGTVVRAHLPVDGSNAIRPTAGTRSNT